MNCPACDQHLRAGARFCDGCGAAVEPTCPAPYVASKCGLYQFARAAAVELIQGEVRVDGGWIA